MKGITFVVAVTAALVGTNQCVGARVSSSSTLRASAKQAAELKTMEGTTEEVRGIYCLLFVVGTNEVAN